MDLRMNSMRQHFLNLFMRSILFKTIAFSCSKPYMPTLLFQYLFLLVVVEIRGDNCVLMSIWNYDVVIEFTLHINILNAIVLSGL